MKRAGKAGKGLPCTPTSAILCFSNKTFLLNTHSKLSSTSGPLYLLHFYLEAFFLLDRSNLKSTWSPPQSSWRSICKAHTSSSYWLSVIFLGVLTILYGTQYIACICPASLLTWENTDLSLAFSQVKISLLINEKWFHLSAEISFCSRQTPLCMFRMLDIFFICPYSLKIPRPRAKSRLLSTEIWMHIPLCCMMLPLWELSQQKCHSGLHRSDLATWTCHCILTFHLLEAGNIQSACDRKSGFHRTWDGNCRLTAEGP